MSDVQWNPEKIDSLTRDCIEVMQDLCDQELAWIVQQLIDDNWEELLEDDNMASFLSAMIVLGISSFAYRRALG